MGCIDIRRALPCIALACALVSGALLHTEALAAQATLSWDYTASGAAGFTLHCGTSSGAYSRRIDVGNTTTYTITGLTAGATYYCVTTAYDSTRLESPYSNQISVAIPSLPGTTPSPLPVPPAPLAAFSASVVSGIAPLSVNFLDSTSGSVTSWFWTFGDGTTSALQNPNHVYGAAGSYAVTLTATGPGGFTSRTLANGIVVSGAPAVSGLVAAYGFEEGAGDRVLDASGYGNSGVVLNATWSTGGRFGKALTFNGHSWITINDAASLQLSDAMTLEAWVYPTATLNDWTDVIMKEQASGVTYYLTASSQWGTPVGGVNIGGEQMVRGTAPLSLNAWSHLAVTHDGSMQRLYVNGVLVSSIAHAGSIDSIPGPLRIGGNSLWGEYFAGMIDEVRIYSRALSAAEIQIDMARAISTGK